MDNGVIYEFILSYDRYNWIQKSHVTNASELTVVMTRDWGVYGVQKDHDTTPPPIAKKKSPKRNDISTDLSFFQWINLNTILIKPIRVWI